MSSRHVVRSFFVAVVSAASLAAQSSVDLPASASGSEGISLAGVTLGSFAFRTQIVVDAAAIAPGGAMLTGLRLRADRTVGPQPAVTIPNVTVSIGSTSVAVGGMSSTYASNITGTMTTVFQGSLNLPAQGGDQYGPRSFDVFVPFNQTVLYVGSQGNLLVDLVGNNPVCFGLCNPFYWLDVASPGGTTSSLGLAGTMASGETPFASVIASGGTDPLLLTVGNTLEFVTTLPLSVPPAVSAFAIAPLPGPIDLAALGAPGNTLWVDPAIVVPLSWSTGFGSRATVPLPLPNLPSLVGVTLWHQTAVLDPAANALGIVTSNATETRIGDGAEVPVMQMCEGGDPAATDGFVLDGYALALRLEGTFF